MEEQPTQGMLSARGAMVTEAYRLIDEARARGIVLRLFGGLAVRTHCELAYVCERDYSDIDLIGRRRQVKEILRLFEALGFEENMDVRVGSDYQELQFKRPCAHADEERHYFLHPDDHVDVFLDAFHMDHRLPLGDRLELEDYTVSLSDLVLTKLQTAHIDEKDERDLVSLLGQSPLGESDERGVVNVSYIARLCAADWGLCYDVLAAITRMRDVFGQRSDLDTDLLERARSALDRLGAAIEAEPKSTKWKLRARIGTRKQWHNDVEEQDAEDHGPPLPGGAAG
jgi:hypothetical protein